MQYRLSEFFRGGSLLLPTSVVCTAWTLNVVFGQDAPFAFTEGRYVIFHVSYVLWVPHLHILPIDIIRQVNFKKTMLAFLRLESSWNWYELLCREMIRPSIFKRKSFRKWNLILKNKVIWKKKSLTFFKNLQNLGKIPTIFFKLSI